MGSTYDDVNRRAHALIRAVTSGLLLLPWVPQSAGADPLSARASGDFGGSCRAYDAAEAVIDRVDGGTVDLAVTPGEMSFVQLPGWIALDPVRFTQGNISVEQVANGVEVIPDARISPDTKATVRLRTQPDAPPVLLHLSIAPDPDRYTRHVMVRAEPREATCQQRVAPYIQREIDRRLDARLDAHTQKLALRTGHQLLSRAVYVPRGRVIDDSDALAAAPGLAAWFETSGPDGARTDFVWSFVLQSPRSVAVAAVRLRSHDGKELYPHVDMGAITAGPAGPGPTPDRSEPAAAHIRRDHRVTGVVYLPGIDIRESDILTLEFLAPDGHRLASVTANGFERSRAVELWSGDTLAMRVPTAPLAQATDQGKGSSEPSQATTGRCRAYETAEAIIDRESGGTIDLAVTPGELSFVRLPDWLRLRQVRFTENAFRIAQLGNGVEIVPPDGISLDTTTTIRLQTDRGAPPIMLRLSISPNPDRYTRHITARDEPLETTCQRLVAPHIDQEVARRFHEKRESYARAAILNTSRQILSRPIYAPRVPTGSERGNSAPSGVTAIPGAAAWIVSADTDEPHTDLMWAFAVDNRLIQTLPIAVVRLRGPDGQEHQPDVVFDAPSAALNAEATGRDLAVAGIPGESRVTGVVRLADTPYQKCDRLTLEFLGPDGRLLTSTTANGFAAVDPDAPDRATVTFYVGEPLTDEEIRRRDEAIAQRRRERAAKRVSVHALGTFGWIWIPDGIVDPNARNKPEAAALTGFGVRVSKGIASWNQGRYYIAIEGEIAAASSATVRFQDVTLDGAQGELSRSVKLGRAQFGTALHLGDRVVPILRVGVGLQMISESAILTSGGDPTSTDSGVEFTQTLMFGAGLDWRINARLTAGLGIIAIAPRDDGLFKQTIEGGLHASYAWNP